MLSRTAVSILLISIMNICYYNDNIFRLFVICIFFTCIGECIYNYKYSLINCGKRFTMMFYLYILLILNNIVYAYKLPVNILYTIGILSSISDISQYLFGKKFGKIYISNISPHKTLEGYTCGFITLYLSYYILPFDILHHEYIICYLLSVCGDCISSYFKRRLHIKDWSLILGETGGMLDRVNSHIAVGLYFIIK